MKDFIAALGSASNHGKGLKCMKSENYINAVHYFKKALEKAEKANDETMIPFELESIAHAYFMLEDFDQAEDCAYKSLKLYEQIEHYGDPVKDGIQRIRDLLDSISTGKT